MVGIEFDWVAADHLNRIGLFCTSGYGPIPAGVIDHCDNHAAMAEAIAELAQIPDWADLLTYTGNIPVFVYDWTPHTGPYRRAQSPRGADPLKVGDLPEQLRELIIRLELSFDSACAIDGSVIENQGVQNVPRNA